MTELLENVIYKSAAMQQVRKELDSCIQTGLPILFWGEGGSGMGFYARAIHEVSRTGKLLRKPCFDLDEHTVQEQLFGVKDQPGWLEEYDNGNIFLKRLEKASNAIQETFLNLLEIQSVDGRIEFCRKGTTETRTANVRFIFSMSKKYDTAIQEGIILRDFVDIIRKRGKIIHLPPLRERKDNIIEIAKNLLDEFNQNHNRKVTFIEPQAQKCLTQYKWPGNIDELKRLFNSIYVKFPEITTISMEHLPEQITGFKGQEYVFSFILKGEKFTGKLLAESLKIKKNDKSKFQVKLDDLLEIVRVEDKGFAPPKFKHFLFTLKDGTQMTGIFEEKTLTIETSFEFNYRINPENVYEISLL